MFQEVAIIFFMDLTVALTLHYPVGSGVRRFGV